MRIEVKTERVAVAFRDVPRGAFFFESSDDNPIAIKKIAANRGAYQRWGMRHEPMYRSDETVYIDKSTRTEQQP